MVPLFQILGPSLVPLLSKTGPLFGPSEGLFEGGTRLVITGDLADFADYGGFWRNLAEYIEILFSDNFWNRLSVNKWSTRVVTH